ncbi:MAG: HAD-IIIA family hydrolase [Myxococcota bacterium]
MNRDDLGGRLDGLVRLLNLVASGRRHLVLDNTYATRKSRAGVIAAAREAGLPVRALWLDTPLEEARWNACLRMIERHGRLLGPDEIKVASKLEANTIPPRAQHHWLETFEPPSTSEGLERIERRAFVRAPSPDTKKGLLLDVDGALRRTRSGELYPRTPEDVELLPGRREALERWLAHGWRIFFTSNQSGIHSGRVRTDMVDRAFARTIELLGLPVDDVVYCPHQAFPVACFCRKPMPGLAALLVTRHHLARPSLVVVGELQSERDFATAIGARYVAPDAFFGVASPPRRRG